MIVILFGSRPPKSVLYGPKGAMQRWYDDNAHFMAEAVALAGFEITEVVCGEAPGFDTLGKRWAVARGIPVKSMPAAWHNRDGSINKSAGFARNRAMGEYGEAGVACWSRTSRGTQHMINILLMQKKPCYVHRV